MKKSVYFIAFMCISVFALSFNTHSQSFTGSKIISQGNESTEFSTLHSNGTTSALINDRILTSKTESLHSKQKTVNSPLNSESVFRISNQPAKESAVYNVGAGQAFSTITEAVNSINNGTISGPVTFLLTDALYTENITAYISPAGASAINTITIKPAPGVNAKITANTSSPVFTIDTFNFLTIDGSNEEGGNSKNLTLENLFPNATVLFIKDFSMQGSQNNTIKNCIFQGGGITDLNTGIRTDPEIANINNWLIENNTFKNLRDGIDFRGNSFSQCENITISRNLFGEEESALGENGVYLAYIDNLILNDNKFQNITCSDYNAAGIFLRWNILNSKVFNNTISNVKYTGSNGYGGKGIIVETQNSASNLLIYNNSISDISGDGYSDLTDDAIVGLRITGSTGGVKVYHNSVHLFGDIEGHDKYNMSAAFYMQSTVTDVSLMNNILVNSINDIVQNSEAFAICCDAPASAFTLINNNNYFAAGDEGELGWLYNQYTSTLAAWKTASGGDANSLSFMPPFESNTNLRLTASNNAGVFITGIDSDHDGTARDTSTPDIGAFEKSGGDGTILNISDAEDFTIVAVNRRILVRSDVSDAEVSVWNATGQQIETGNLTGGVLSEITVHQPGVYIVSINTDKGVKAIKVLCK